MAVVTDAASLSPMTSSVYQPSEALIRATLKLNVEGKNILSELDEYEAISLAFLVLDQDQLAQRAFIFCQKISHGRYKECIEEIINSVRSRKGQLDAIVSALYIIGRYDLLEDHFSFCVDHNLHKVFKELQCIDSDRKSLYCVFAGMAQEEADRLVHTRLSRWYCRERGRPLEETFVRNLNGQNYQQLINELFNALREENRETLASYLKPYIRISRPVRVGSQISNFNEENFYPLPTAYPHGLCIIINVKNFMEPRGHHDNIPLNERHGSDIDKDRLTGTFKLFGFHVIHFDNPDYEQINQFFKRLRVDPRLAVVSCLAVCVMTHGDEQDQIYLHDRSCLLVTDLRKLCSSRVLLNKPRLFFVQACRGEEALRPIFLQQDGSVVAHQESDCLISQASVKGYSAFRNQMEGSWYITDLCQALQEYGHVLPIKNVLHKTRKNLKERVENMNNTYITQLSEEKDTLTREVQFVRADLDHFTDGLMDLIQLEVTEKLVEEKLEEAIFEMFS
ncbi:caspase-8-like [Penaeus japonicus]|uniref:caspase-8-like n=1 Tax=Penaeus japonicus TaxID=27405 RepID=UPI001C70F2FA|nr:caspase-8-like [Penaeus japonicus]XP_042873693.1 caspase-8-like [Penaeus japonicus]